MLDSTLRPVKDRILSPMADALGDRVPPTAISSFALACSVAAAIAASRDLAIVAVVCWLVGRVGDGVDGLVARSTGRASDLGGLLDFTFDAIGYAAIPVGLAVGIGDRMVWVATAVLLATFYVNAASLGYVAALLEKRDLGAGVRGEATSATLPRGLVEGSETILFFTVALAVPAAATTIWWVMAAAVAITALERVRWASGRLR